MEYSWKYFLEYNIFGALNILIYEIFMDIFFRIIIFGALNILIYGIFMDILLKLQYLVHKIF